MVILSHHGHAWLGVQEKHRQPKDLLKYARPEDCKCGGCSLQKGKQEFFNPEVIKLAKQTLKDHALRWM